MNRRLAYLFRHHAKFRQYRSRWAFALSAAATIGACIAWWYPPTAPNRSVFSASADSDALIRTIVLAATAVSWAALGWLWGRPMSEASFERLAATESGPHAGSGPDRRARSWGSAPTLIGGLLIAVASMMVLGFYGYLSEPPLAPATPAPIRVAPPLTQRVVLVLIDGLREAEALREDLMPTLASRRPAAAWGVSITPEMTLTTLSVIDLATGLTPGISWSIKNFDAEPFEDENLVQIAAAAGFPPALVGDASWSQLFGEWAELTFAVRDEGFMKGADTGLPATDREILRVADDALANPAHRFVVIHVVGVDKTAHREGAASGVIGAPRTPYEEVIAATDTALAALLDRYDDGNTTWLVTSDHGVTQRGTHGGGETETRRAPFVLWGPGVRAAAGQTVPMTSMAPTLAALMGARPPRTAETPAVMEWLTHSEADQSRLLASHAALRARVATAQMVEMGQMGMGAAGSGPTLSPQAEIERAARSLFDWDSNRRRPFRWALILVGLLAQWWVAGWLAQRVGAASPASWATLWTAGAAALLAWPRWQFTVVQWLGEFRERDQFGTASAWGLAWGWRFAGAAVAVFALWRWLGPRAARTGEAGEAASTPASVETWTGISAPSPASIRMVLLLGGTALTLGMSVVRWPYGPLAAFYRHTLLILFLVATAGAQRAYARRWWAVAAGVVAGYLVLFGLRGESSAYVLAMERDLFGRTVWLDLLWLLALGAIIRPGARRADFRLWATAGLAVAALVVARVDSSWSARAFLAAFVVCGVAWLAPLGRIDAAGRIRGAAVVVFAAFRAFARPDTALVWALIGLLAWHAAPLVVRSKRGALAAALAVVALELSLFREFGYEFSFAALDMRIAFAATRDTIRLGEGFALLMLRHWTPWMAIFAPIAAYLTTLRAAGQQQALSQLYAVGVLWGVMTMAWGALHSFGRFADDHWYTMHAVPLAVFRLASMLLATTTAAVCAAATWSAARSAAPHDAALRPNGIACPGEP